MSKILPTRKSQNIVNKISNEMEGHTFHHHFHILYDIVESITVENRVKEYFEIGTFYGASASLVISHPTMINVTCLDKFGESSKEAVERNLHKFSYFETKNFEVIEGDSQSEETINLIHTKKPIIDLFYIDGDHSYNGCIQDFLNYQDLVVSGGYVVFDDYHDVNYSPQVKHAVDYIVSELLFDQYDVIGSFRNSLGAKPAEMIFNNEFILRKK